MDQDDRALLTVRVPMERKRALEELAKRMGTTVSAQVNIAISCYVDVSYPTAKAGGVKQALTD